MQDLDGRVASDILLPHRMGQSIPTPALVLDLDVLDANIRRMQGFLADAPAGLRPHAKTHKTPRIALRQIEAGAVGICCAKLGEAEAMVEAGVGDILVANQVVGGEKARRLARLERRTRVAVAVDSVENARELSRAARAEKVEIPFLVEADIGMSRCGCEVGEELVTVAGEAARAPGLKMTGLMGYEGHCVFVEDPAEKEKKTKAALSLLARARSLLLDAGLPVEVVSSGGTGTYAITGRTDFVTEIQAGSYATMDARYARLSPEFKPAVTVEATVISVRRDYFVCDAGMKAMTSEFGAPSVLGPDGARTVGLSEEHAKVALEGARGRVSVGARVRFLPTHGCTTFNLHDRLFVERGGEFTDEWKVSARGRFA